MDRVKTRWPVSAVELVFLGGTTEPLLYLQGQKDCPLLGREQGSQPRVREVGEGPMQ